MMDETLTVCYNALYSGAYFGELAMLTGQPRTATALAVTDCVLFYINQQDFNLVARKWPKALATILAKAKERLERINNNNSQSLAAQLGDRLSEVGRIVAEETHGILNCAPSQGGSFGGCSQSQHETTPRGGSEARATATPWGAGHRNSMCSISCRETGASTACRETGADASAPANASAHGYHDGYGERERFRLWQRQIESAVQKSNEGVQLILERLVTTQLGDTSDSTTNRLANVFMGTSSWSGLSDKDGSKALSA